MRRATRVQLRYLVGFSLGHRVLRPAAEDGEYGDLRVVRRLKDAGWIAEEGLTFRLTHRGEDQLPCDACDRRRRVAGLPWCRFCAHRDSRAREPGSR